MANAANWWNGNSTQAPPGNDILTFDNAAQLLLQNNLSGAATNRHRLLFQPGCGPRVINGTTWNQFRSYNTALPRLENYSGAPQSITFPFSVAAHMEINAIGAGITFETNVNLLASQVRIRAVNGPVVFGTNAIFAGTGSVAVNQGMLSFAGQPHTYAGLTLINTGAVEILSGGPTNTIEIGTAGSTESSALVLGAGVSISNRIEVRSGSGHRIIGSSAQSGIAKISGNIVLATAMIVSNTEGGTLQFVSPVTVNGHSIRMTNSGEVAFSNTVSSTSGLGVLIKAGGGTLTLAGATDNRHLGLMVADGTAVLAKASSADIQAVNGELTIIDTLLLGGTGGNQISNLAQLTLVGGTFDMNGRKEEVGSISGRGLITNSGVLSVELAAGRNNLDTTFAGSIVDGPAGKVEFVKNGAGTLFLRGVNTYSGITKVNGGVLATTPSSLGRGEFIVYYPATLALICDSNEVFHLGKLTLNGFITIGAPSWREMIVAPVQTSGTFNYGPSSGINVAGGDIFVGQFPLLRWTTRSLTGTPSINELPPGVIGSLVDNATNQSIDLRVTSVRQLSWTGAQGTNWDAKTDNWKGPTGSPVVYYETAGGGWSVRFDDSATGTTTVNLATNVSPISIVVSNSTKAYTMRGSNRIVGYSGLTKTGTGRLTLESSLTNEFTGKTIVERGILEIQGAHSLGSPAAGTIVTGGTLEVRGGVTTAEPLVLGGTGATNQGAVRCVSGTNIFLGPVTIASNTLVQTDAGLLVFGGQQISGDTATLTIAGAGSSLFSNRITVASLIKKDAGAVTLLGSNAVESVTINSGLLRLDGTNAGRGPVDIQSGGILSVRGTFEGVVTVGGALSPGPGCASVRSASEFWSAGGALALDIADASGQTGTGWDHITVNGGVDLQATAGAPFTIRVASLNNGAAGPCANFDYNTAAEWPVVTTSNGVTNFNSSAVTFDFASFSNDLAGGTLDLARSGNDLNLRFTPNRAPTASGVVCVRSAGMPHKIAIAELLSTAVSDPDGDSCVIETVGAASAGGTVLRDSAWIYYMPGEDDGDDSFSFTVRDLRSYRSNDTVRTASAIVTITTQRPGGSVQTISMTGGVATIQFAGIPNYVYDVERSTNLVSWTVLDTKTAPADGVFTFVDTNPPMPSAYYRLRQR